MEYKLERRGCRSSTMSSLARFLVHSDDFVIRAMSAHREDRSPILASKLEFQLDRCVNPEESDGTVNVLNRNLNP